MTATGSTWIEIQGETSGGYGAQFACRVRLRPFATLEEFRWGWNRASLLEEALDRQVQFIEAQHIYEDYPGQARETARRALLLRYIHTPDAPELRIALIGKVTAATAALARQGAEEYWEAVCSGFPYDYSLRPALCREEFLAISRQDLIAAGVEAEARGAGAVVELRRYVNELRGIERAILIPGQWHWTNLANEQVWRALHGCSKAVVYQVTLQPLALHEEERRWFQQQVEAAAAMAKDERESGLVRRYAEYAARVLGEQTQSYRNHFIEQVHLIAPAGVPDYLTRAVGASFVHGEDRPAFLPGYQVLRPTSPGLAGLCHNSAAWNLPGSDPVFNRLAYLMPAKEAHVAFRLPFPSAGGIPGMVWEVE